MTISIQGINAVNIFKQGIITKQALSDASEAVAKGLYDATILSAVDADLAAANIKSGVTIFGKLGTLVSGSLAEDVLNEAQSALVTGASTEPLSYLNQVVTALSDLDVATCTTNFNANSRAVGSGFAFGMPYTDSVFKLRLYMNGVQVAESDFWISGGTITRLLMVKGTAALSGSKIVKIALHNYDAGDQTFRVHCRASGYGVAIGVMVGSIKVV